MGPIPDLRCFYPKRFTVSSICAYILIWVAPESKSYNPGVARCHALPTNLNTTEQRTRFPGCCLSAIQHTTAPSLASHPNPNLRTPLPASLHHESQGLRWRQEYSHIQYTRGEILNPYILNCIKKSSTFMVFQWASLLATFGLQYRLDTIHSVIQTFPQTRYTELQKN